MDTKEICQYDDDEFQQWKESLPKGKAWPGLGNLSFFQRFWCPSYYLKGVISCQKHFQALDSDIIVITIPKCGTTWLKALAFSIVNRHGLVKEENPLLTSGSHELVRFLEVDLYLNNPCPDLDNSYPYRPRMFSSHLPYASLPSSINTSNSKIVYMCRNPMDMFISLWQFSDKLRLENTPPLSLDEAFEMFCQGNFGYGPFFDHVLGYWKASQENPRKIMFLQYENVKGDVVSHVKRLADFLGFSFSEEEEKEGVIEEIAKVCSFENLKELDVNKNSISTTGIPFKIMFRKGEVGDWNNYFTPTMRERLEKLIQENLDMSGLTFKFSA